MKVAKKMKMMMKKMIHEIFNLYRHETKKTTASDRNNH